MLLRLRGLYASGAKAAKRERLESGLLPGKQVRRGHDNQQPPSRVADTRFYHYCRPATMHGRGLGSHRALIGVAQEIRAELDSKGELLGAAVERAT